MSEVYPSYGNSFIPKSDRANPTRVMMKIIEDNPRAAPAKRMKLFVDEAIEDPELCRAALLAEACNLHNNCMKIREKEKVMAMTPAKLKRAREKRAAERMAVETKAAVVIEKVKTHILLNTVMNCTRSDLAKLIKDAPKLSGILKMLKGNQRVADVASRTDVLKVLNGK